jgi:REP element-mobilizing transposase RayT
VRDLYDIDSIKVWQNGYHEHGIRDAAELERIRDYIRSNPANWREDPENPANAKNSA